MLEFWGIGVLGDLMGKQELRVLRKIISLFQASSASQLASWGIVLSLVPFQYSRGMGDAVPKSRKCATRTGSHRRDLNAVAIEQEAYIQQMHYGQRILGRDGGDGCRAL